jgi:hypothetical protein
LPRTRGRKQRRWREERYNSSNLLTANGFV